MPSLKYPPPEAFTLIDLTGITNPAELEAMLKYAQSCYKRHVESICKGQVLWATLLSPSFNDPANAPLLAMAQQFIKQNELKPHYEPFGEIHYDLGQPQDAIPKNRDTILIDAQPLFIYSSAERVELQVNHHGLCISRGAEHVYQHQQSSFPIGPYGTTIPPYNQDINQAAMHCKFFDIEWSLPSIHLNPTFMQAAIQTNHWIMIIPTTGFLPKGQLVFSHIDSGFKGIFDHYALATPNLSPGTYLPYDIVAFGDTLIPEEIPGTQITHTLTVNTETTSHSAEIV
ncbi:uncharacterized protein LACBIDRAFT_330581 [Laccaria bicolor S238N-H82]|uniref:Predicted protein n=1 Tax=Laccaria bicolor (strain S238N-H82 / ATCC MYA-4686) TaxID=486041 RepID=B0DLS5_LACBS|nr:uncharacterized protein LACBIDRAFT_330581 [Laccaria bicolor S238N-H82]EDR04444.1 predicted protein [Laccaria bicolor S238N-H82]|eukprot:XP_001884963.1 predicted protein [Laccaria bicolor S238N-H82]